MAPIKELRVRVYGLVQGVFFRAFTRECAVSLGLKGYVRNMPDGSVEIVAQGEEEKLKKLLEKVKIGPPAAEVEHVEEQWGLPMRKYENFEIIR
ncbi:MAG: acylphosphatase [Candidatus Diapherotrites archaeon]